MFKVYKEWLVDENGNTVYKPLSFWIEYFGITPVDNGCYFKQKNGKFIDIEVHGGYGLNWEDRDKYENELFFVGNADLDRCKVRIKYW